MPTVRLKDIEVYYEEHGHGEPVLLVPPSWWPCDAWKVVVLPILSQRYRTIIFDPRGTGRSERPDHGYTLSLMRRATTTWTERRISTKRYATQPVASCKPSNCFAGASLSCPLRHS